MKRKQRFFKLSALVGCILLGVGIVMGSAGFVAMGCDLDAFTYPRGGEPAAVSSFVVADAVDSIEIHASMGDVKLNGPAPPTQRMWRSSWRKMCTRLLCSTVCCW